MRTFPGVLGNELAASLSIVLHFLIPGSREERQLWPETPAQNQRTPDRGPRRRHTG